MEMDLSEARRLWRALGLTSEQVARLEAEAVAETGGDPDPAEAAAQTREKRPTTHAWIERGEMELRNTGLVVMMERPKKGKKELIWR